MLGEKDDGNSPKIKAFNQSDGPPQVSTTQLHERGPGTSKSKVGYIFNKNKYTTSGAMEGSASPTSQGRINQMSNYLSNKLFGGKDDVKKRVQLAMESVPDDKVEKF